MRVSIVRQPPFKYGDRVEIQEPDGAVRPTMVCDYCEKPVGFVATSFGTFRREKSGEWIWIADHRFKLILA